MINCQNLRVIFPLGEIQLPHLPLICLGGPVHHSAQSWGKEEVREATSVSPHSRRISHQFPPSQGIIHLCFCL